MSKSEKGVCTGKKEKIKILLDFSGAGGYNGLAICVHDPLAQLVEHLTFNQRARGSSPRRVTKEKP